jgi:hypothetical protein
VPILLRLQQGYEAEPLPTCVSEENAMKYPIVSSDEYLKWRAEQAKKALEVMHGVVENNRK